MIKLLNLFATDLSSASIKKSCYNTFIATGCNRDTLGNFVQYSSSLKSFREHGTMTDFTVPEAAPITPSYVFNYNFAEESKQCICALGSFLDDVLAGTADDNSADSAGSILHMPDEEEVIHASNPQTQSVYSSRIRSEQLAPTALVTCGCFHQCGVTKERRQVRKCSGKIGRPCGKFICCSRWWCATCKQLKDAAESAAAEANDE
jgi:hypothetical protein